MQQSTGTFYICLPSECGSVNIQQRNASLSYNLQFENVVVFIKSNSNLLNGVTIVQHSTSKAGCKHNNVESKGKRNQSVCTIVLMNRNEKCVIHWWIIHLSKPEHIQALTINLLKRKDGNTSHLGQVSIKAQSAGETMTLTSQWLLLKQLYLCLQFQFVHIRLVSRFLLLTASSHFLTTGCLNLLYECKSLTVFQWTECLITV